MEPETAELISEHIIHEIKHSGTAKLLLNQIRCGNARFINQNAWDVIADYLEKHMPKSIMGHPKEDHWMRNKMIAEKFREKREKGVKQNTAYYEIAEEMNSNVNTVAAVVNESRNEQKLILKLQKEQEINK